MIRAFARKERLLLWLKALHVIAMVTWFAGLFYLPRLFVYHADAADSLGVAAISDHGTPAVRDHDHRRARPPWFSASPCSRPQPGVSAMGWLRAKLLLVALLIVYHLLLL